MDSDIAREVIRIIRREAERRSDEQGEDPNLAYDQSLFTDEPFINDMCLMVLVALRHQLERKLASLVARLDVGESITGKTYQRNLAAQRKRPTNRGGSQTEGYERRDPIAALQLESFPAWKTSLKALQLLANCLKHEPTQQPDEELLTHLKLPLKPEGRLIVGYLPLSESNCFREGLAGYLGLPKNADYCAIVETCVGLTARFLQEVQQRTPLARVTGAVPLNEFAC